MNVFLYDHTFEGFLSAIFYYYESKIEPDRIMGKNNYQKQVFDNKIQIISEIPKAERVQKGIEKKTSKGNFQKIYRVFLSELPNVEMILLNFIRKVFDATENIEINFSDATVLEIDKIHRKVMREAEKVLMFVRFQRTSDNIYYATFEPKYNVLPISINHFKDRFADQKWMIFDAKREYGYYYDMHDIQEVRFTQSNINAESEISEDILNEEEVFYKKLWQNYYDSINIEERKNLKLQMQFMPKRFWKNLPEKNRKK